MENKKRYSLTLSPEIVKKAKIFAIDHDTSFSALVEKALVKLMHEGNSGNSSISPLRELPNCWK